MFNKILKTSALLTFILFCVIFGSMMGGASQAATSDDDVMYSITAYLYNDMQFISGATVTANMGGYVWGFSETSSAVYVADGSGLGPGTYYVCACR